MKNRIITATLALVILLSLMSTSAQAIKLSELSPEAQAEVKAMMEESSQRYEEMRTKAEQEWAEQAAKAEQADHGTPARDVVQGVVADWSNPIWAELEAADAKLNAEKYQAEHANNPVETANPVTTPAPTPSAKTESTTSNRLIRNQYKFDGTPLYKIHSIDYTGLDIYPDVPSNAWYAQAVNCLSEGDIIQGKPDGLFHPDDIVTQAEFAIILCRMYGYDYENYWPDDAVINNCDIHYGYEDNISIKRHWALPAIWSASLDVGLYKLNLAGYTADNPVWRGDAITQLVWAVGSMSTWTDSGNGSDLKQFTEKVWTQADIPDWDDVAFDTGAWAQAGYVGREYAEYSGHDWCSEDILEAYNAGLTQGVDAQGTCNPFGELTRAELAQMLYNAGITEWGDILRPGITPNEWAKWRDANNPYKK